MENVVLIPRNSIQAVGLAWHAPPPPLSLRIARLPVEDLRSLRGCPYDLRRLIIGNRKPAAYNKIHTVRSLKQSQFIGSRVSDMPKTEKHINVTFITYFDTNSVLLRPPNGSRNAV